MAFVIITSKGFGALPGIVSWPILIGALYGCVRLVVDVLRFTARFRFMRRAVEREQAKAAARRAKRAPSPPAAAAEPAAPFAWWPGRDAE